MNNYEIEIGGKPLKIQTGILAQMANGSVTVRQGDTIVLVTATMADPREGIDFFPLTVDYEERLYAIGKIPGGFPRRENRPSNDAILAMRLTDRPIRPLFPKGFRNEVQIVATTLSADQEHQPDTLITIGASAALAISDIPFLGPVSSVRVAKIGDEYVVNPTFEQSEDADLDIIVAGTNEAVVMVEAGAREAAEDSVVEAIEKAMEANRAIIALQEQMIATEGKEKKPYTPAPDYSEVRDAIGEYLADRVDDVVATAASERSDANKLLRTELREHFGERFTGTEINEGLFNYIKKAMRGRILGEGRRADDRNPDQIRDLDIHVGVLPRTHGTGLFQRGQTQVLSVATLAGVGMAQKLDTLSPQTSKRYMHHYNFPPYSVGEARQMRGPGRRDIGHGALAERALEPVLPDTDEFPYVLRVVSEVMSSNGSSSMASVCGSTLALMDAGVPIAAPVAGVAMGLIMGEDGNYAVLTDIAGAEDFMGDMDFKVAGTSEGITALQMDIKIGGVSREVLTQALDKARIARLTILAAMSEVLAEPRSEVAEYAPKMFRMQIGADQIGSLIGPGGRNVRRIQEETGTNIDIEEDGTVFIAATDSAGAEAARRMIDGLTREISVGDVYKGRVTRHLNFGVFIEILPGKEGMVRLPESVSAEDVGDIGDEVEVRVAEVDDRGRINLRLAGDTSEPEPRGDRGGGRRPRAGGDRGGDRGPRRDDSRGGDRDRGPRRDNGPRDNGPPRADASRGRRPPPRDRAPREQQQPQSSGQRFANTGASRSWTRRGESDGPPAPPPPPRADLGSGYNDDEE